MGVGSLGIVGRGVIKGEGAGEKEWERWRGVRWRRGRPGVAVVVVGGLAGRRDVVVGFGMKDVVGDDDVDCRIHSP